MIESRPAARPPWWIAVVVLVASLIALPVSFLDHRGTPAPVSARPASSTAPAGPGPVAAIPRRTPLLKLTGPVPAHGQGRFSYATASGPVLGTSGPVRRFHVAVEQGSGENLATFTAIVEATLSDPRSWVGDRRLRLRRVRARARADFTIYLATRTTAGRMCEAGGTNISYAGRPYTSCRTRGRAIINLDRWRLSAPPYLRRKVPLSVYRQYVINHEVGHELGHHHEGCPHRGGPAPVMVQQTLTLRGCAPYAWPRRHGHRLAGPPV
jgi:hypothetical protein